MGKKEKYEQMSFDDLICDQVQISKPIRLITTFSGYDSQKLAFNYLGIDVEHYKTCEWAIKSIQALYDIHFSNDKKDYSKDIPVDEIYSYLTNKGISANYNDPLDESQVKKLGEINARKIYNNIMAEHNLVNIMQVHDKDLEIVDREKYEYIFTYSFPCQDLSLAGLRKGMSVSQANGGTRSGLLWEVERILCECSESNSLPQVLMMENVPEVIGEKNIKDFQKWELKLESLGYKNFIDVLNAKDYGVPQNRRRCFMVSILCDSTYKFCRQFKLIPRLKHMLENNVDEKYYLSDKKIKSIINWKAQQRPLTKVLGNNSISPTITSRGAGEDHSGMIIYSEKLEDTTNVEEKYFAILEATKKGYAEAYEGDGVYINRPQQKRGVVQKGMIQTLKTSPDVGVVVPPLRIRKLTPKECFRLMGVSDSDYEKVVSNQSNASLYHLAGDSIVTTVMMGIFGKLVGLSDEEIEEKIKHFVDNNLVEVF